MAFIHNIGFILLGILLIVGGICLTFSVGHPVLWKLLHVLAVASGVFILIGK